MKTDRNELVRGLKVLGITVLCMFAGPTLIYIGLGNPEKPLYYPLLISGIIVCIAAILLGFRGIRIIMNSMFNPPNSNQDRA